MPDTAVYKQMISKILVTGNYRLKESTQKSPADGKRSETPVWWAQGLHSLIYFFVPVSSVIIVTIGELSL